MKIILKNSSDFPVYEQIKQQVKQNILEGHAAPGEHLSSMRGLAKDLRISLITTRRAYEDLEKDGFVITIRGKETFVKGQGSSILRGEQFFTIEDLVKELVNEAQAIEISLEEL